MAGFKVKGVKAHAVRPRTVLTAVLVAALLVVAWFQRDNIASVVRAVSQGAVIPLIAASAFETCRIVFHSHAYTRSFRVIGASVPLRATIPAWFKAVFMNTVLPSGGTSGLAAVVDAARQRGVAVGSATSATIFTQTCFYSSMLLVIVCGFFVMARSGALQVRDVLLGCVMGVAAFAFVGLLAMGHYAPGLLQRILRRVEGLATRACAALRLKKMPKPWADNLVHSFSSAATELSRRPRQALAVFATMVVAMTFDLLAFVAAGFAFGITRPEALLGGYVTALVFNSFNVTPGGVGVVEGLASAVLAGYGYPVAQSVSVVLVYRALMYWVPFLIGGVMMHVTGAFGLGGQKVSAPPAAGQAASPADQAARRVRATTAAASAAVVAHISKNASDDDLYLHRRRSDAPLGERVVAFIHNTIKLRTVLCALMLVATAVVGFAAAALPADPVMVEAVANRVLGHDPLDPLFMVVFSYVLLLCVPGILLHDQGNWLMAMLALLGLGFSTALSGHSVWATACVIASLAFFAGWRGCFDAHGFFGSLTRLVRVLAYAVAVAALYALVGSLFARGAMAPDPGLGGALWMGLQSLAVFPATAGVLLAPEAVQFFASVGAVRVTLTVMLVFVIVSIGVRRAVDWHRPEKRAARASAHAAAESAAAERKAARQERWGRKRAEVASALRERRDDAPPAGGDDAATAGGDDAPDGTDGSQTAGGAPAGTEATGGPAGTAQAGEKPAPEGKGR